MSEPIVDEDFEFSDPDMIGRGSTIVVKFDMDKGILSFIIDGVDFEY